MVAPFPGHALGAGQQQLLAAVGQDGLVVADLLLGQDLLLDVAAFGQRVLDEQHGQGAALEELRGLGKVDAAAAQAKAWPESIYP